MDDTCIVSPGDPWRPDSARRHNQLSEMLNRFGTTGAGLPLVSGGTSEIFITCVNTSKETVRAGDFVSIGEPVSREGSSELADWIYEMTPGVASPCGIAVEECESGKTAQVQISGLCEGISEPVPASVLQICRSGGGLALYLLNSTGCDTYHNYFKVVPSAYKDGKLLKVRIIDGADPAGEFAGYTDTGQVRSTELEVKNARYICLTMGETLEQSFEMRDVPPPETSPCLVLAEIAGGRLIQRWVGGKVYWRNRFIVKFPR